MARQLKLTFVAYDDDCETTYSAPAKYEVCERCEGTGSHSNPSIDGNGITASEWDEWDDDSRQMYLSGGYDVRCTVCNGERVVLTINRERCEPNILAAYDAHIASEREYEREVYSERRMEAMMLGEWY